MEKYSLKTLKARADRSLNHQGNERIGEFQKTLVSDDGLAQVFLRLSNISHERDFETFEPIQKSRYFASSDYTCHWLQRVVSLHAINVKGREANVTDYLTWNVSATHGRHLDKILEKEYPTLVVGVKRYLRPQMEAIIYENMFGLTSFTKISGKDKYKLITTTIKRGVDESPFSTVELPSKVKEYIVDFSKPDSFKEFDQRHTNEKRGMWEL